MRSCFLDTCTLLDLMRGQSQAVDAAEPYNEFFIAFVILGELIRGAHGSRDTARELARIETWLSQSQARVVGADTGTAYVYGELLADLESRGLRIPTNDVWAAAVAIQFELPLLSRDGHFGRIGALRWVGY